MSPFIGDPNFDHERKEGTAVLLTNLGTPEALTVGAVRRYLAQFLADSRVIELPKWLWLPILYGAILPFRPRRSLRAYRAVWTSRGSPLLTFSSDTTEGVQKGLRARGIDVPVRLAMRYGRPSISEVLSEFRGQGLAHLVVLPLYPQYSGTTTGSTFDAVTRELSRWRRVPGLTFIDSYHRDEGYIEALACSIEEAWRQAPRGERLLFSFHGIPQRYFEAGDPYYCHCQVTARMVSERLELAPTDYAVSFQSRVNRQPWLQPYTDEILVEWAANGVRRVDVVCPGFAADCLETLEEIAIGERARFEGAGGERLRYLPALNAAPAHTEALSTMVERALEAMPHKPI
ncbi:MAG: ferrochelatase [Chromatiales bacterium]|jgi:protoporphyrin/coproporphyrin ferrochelatase|nr:ferrochelatase [Chromatiales bacterium]